MTYKIQTDGQTRDMTADEVAAFEEWRARANNDAAANANMASARESALAKLADLGLTETEIKALVG